MENLNAEQIKKALECCANWKPETGCKGCPIEKNCTDIDITKEALALINSQEQRIGELTEDYKALDMDLRNANTDVERLRKKLDVREKDLNNTLDLLYKAEADNERLRAEKEAAIEDLEHCMYFAKPKNPNTCNFCTHDCEVSKDGTRCKGKEDWIYCSPVWRGFVKPKAEGE